MEPLIHLILPLTALTLLGVDFRKALPLALFGLLPDLDALLLIHRSLSHSLPVLLAFAAGAALLAYAVKPGLRNYIVLATLATASHPILDLFTGYTPILWPLSSHSLWVKTELGVHIGGSLTLLPSVKLLAQPTTFHRLESLDAPLFTGEGLITSLILTAPLILKAVRGHYQPHTDTSQESPNEPRSQTLKIESQE